MPETEQKSPIYLLRPFLLLGYSSWYFVLTIISLILNLQFSTLFNIDELKEVHFARFWAFFGPKSREMGAPAVVPLLSNHATGVCLDIGPGSGQWLYNFQKANNPGITKIYGVEPNPGMHAELRANAVKAGLGDIYEIIGCGAEELQTKGGFQKESIDTIITLQCLCSVPTPQTIIKELYPVLKPGGQWLVFEHVKTPFKGDFVAYWQKGINVIWPHFFNGCDLTRPTDQWLQEVGDWDEVTLKLAQDVGRYDAVPHVVGTLTKKQSTKKQR